MEKPKYFKFRFVFTVFALLWVGFFLFGNKGVFALWNLQKECEQLNSEIKKEELRIDSLKIVYERLESDSAFIARKVRENLGYIDSGETLIKFVNEE